VLQVLFMAGFGSVVFAHDPYELTGTASFFSNRLELVVVMPPRTAMRLAESDGRQALDLRQPGEFDEMLPRLTAQAGDFWRIMAAANPVPPLATNVSLVEEDHVQFQLVAPLPPAGPVQLEAAGLGRLPAEDPYGVVLRVLDRVHAGVLVDEVLWADAPKLEVVWAGLPTSGGKTMESWKQVAGFAVLIAAIGLVVWAARQRSAPSN
jgi:hypothetical protein